MRFTIPRFLFNVCHASMTSPLALALHLLLLFAAVEQILGVASTQSTTKMTYPRGSITAKLIRRDQYFADESDVSTSREKVEREARRSMLRVQYLSSKRELAETAPSPGTADWEATLSNAAAAEYLMEIDLGTPPQKFVAIADTGSDLTWLKCAPCQSGCLTGSIFEPTESSTYTPLPCSSIPCRFLNSSGAACPVSNDVPAAGCGYGYGYGDGSVTRGTLAQETFTVQTVTGGSQSVPDFWFGCSTNAASNTSLLLGTDGLVGLGRGNISFPIQLGKYFGNTFGYCLANRSFSPGIEETSLFFGSDAVPNATLQYTPFLNNVRISTFYYVDCTGIGLNGNTIDTIPASAFAIAPDGTGGFFFDSGTTYTFLSEPIFTPFVAALKAQITDYVAISDYHGFDLCYVVPSWSDWIVAYGTSVPAISFQLTNTTGFTLAVDNAWVQMDSLTVCLAILSNAGDLSIFGNVQQVGFHVLYDLENEQLGFVKANCTPTNLAQLQASTQSNSQRTVVSVGSSLLSAILSLLLLTCPWSIACSL